MENHEIKLKPKLTNRFLQKIIKTINTTNPVTLNSNDNTDPSKTIGYLESSQSQKFREQQSNISVLEHYKIQLVRSIKNDANKYLLAFGFYYLEALFKFNQEDLADHIGQILRKEFVFINDKSKQNRKKFIFYIGNLIKLFFPPQQSPEEFSKRVSQLLTNEFANNQEFATLVIDWVKSKIKLYWNLQNCLSTKWFENHSEQEEIKVLTEIFRIKVYIINPNTNLESCTPKYGENPKMPSIYLLYEKDKIYICYTNIHTQKYFLSPYEMPSLMNSQLMGQSLMYFSQIPFNESSICSKCKSLCSKSSLSCGHNLCENCMINLFTQDLIKPHNQAFNDIECEECKKALIGKKKIKFI